VEVAYYQYNFENDKISGKLIIEMVKFQLFVEVDFYNMRLGKCGWTQVSFIDHSCNDLRNLLV